MIDPIPSRPDPLWGTLWVFSRGSHTTTVRMFPRTMVPKAYSTCLVKLFRPWMTIVSIKTKIRNPLSCSCWTSAEYNWECLGCHKHLVLTPKGNKKGPQKGATWMHSHLALTVVKKAWGGVGGITRKSYFTLKSELKILWSPHRLQHSCIFKHWINLLLL